MGIDYGQSILVGYRIEQNELLSNFLEIISPVTYREEDRFDPKTGKKIGTEQVIDQPGEDRYAFDGQDITDSVYNNPDVIPELIAKKFNCEQTLMGNFVCGELYYFFYLPIKTCDDGVDEGRHNFGPSLDYQDVIASHAKFKILGDQLKELGLDADGPNIWNAVAIG